MFGKFGKVLTTFYNRSHTVLFQKGTAKTRSGENIPTLEAGLAEIAKCNPCGCDPCNGVRTWYNPQTGETLGMYIKGPKCGPYEVVIECLADAHKNATALKNCQLQEEEEILEEESSVDEVDDEKDEAIDV